MSSSHHPSENGVICSPCLPSSTHPSSSQLLSSSTSHDLPTPLLFSPSLDERLVRMNPKLLNTSPPHVYHPHPTTGNHPLHTTLNHQTLALLAASSAMMMPQAVRLATTPLSSNGGTHLTCNGGTPLTCNGGTLRPSPPSNLFTPSREMPATAVIPTPMTTSPPAFINDSILPLKSKLKTLPLILTKAFQSRSTTDVNNPNLNHCYYELLKFPKIDHHLRRYRRHTYLSSSPSNLPALPPIVPVPEFKALKVQQQQVVEAANLLLSVPLNNHTFFSSHHHPATYRYAASSDDEESVDDDDGKRTATDNTMTDENDSASSASTPKHHLASIIYSYNNPSSSNKKVSNHACVKGKIGKKLDMSPLKSQSAPRVSVNPFFAGTVFVSFKRRS